jgi:hypothetical protein
VIRVRIGYAIHTASESSNVMNADESKPMNEDWWQFMQRTRRELEAAGRPFMNEQEMAAHIAWLREGDAIDEMLAQTELTNPALLKPQISEEKIKNRLAQGGGRPLAEILSDLEKGI